MGRFLLVISMILIGLIVLCHSGIQAASCMLQVLTLLMITWSLHIIYSRKNMSYSSPFFRKVALPAALIPLAFVLLGIIEFLVAPFFIEVRNMQTYFVLFLERFGLSYPFCIVSMLCTIIVTGVGMTILVKLTKNRPKKP